MKYQSIAIALTDFEGLPLFIVAKNSFTVNCGFLRSINNVDMCAAVCRSPLKSCRMLNRFKIMPISTWSVLEIVG